MDFMDTVDPRIERAQTRTGLHRRVHMPSYYVRWGVVLTVLILIVALATIWA